jgi:hypothetical protein
VRPTPFEPVPDQLSSAPSIGFPFTDGPEKPRSRSSVTRMI